MVGLQTLDRVSVSIEPPVLKAEVLDPSCQLVLQLGVLLQLERLCEPVPREAALHCVDVVGKPIAVAFPLVVSLPSAYPLLVRPSRLKVRWVGFNFGYSVIITVLCIQALHHLDICGETAVVNFESSVVNLPVPEGVPPLQLSLEYQP